MGITYGDHLIDSGHYDITPEQERELDCPICNGDCSAIPGGPPYNCPTYPNADHASSSLDAAKDDPAQLADDIARADTVKLRFGDEVYQLTEEEVGWIVDAMRALPLSNGDRG